MLALNRALLCVASCVGMLCVAPMAFAGDGEAVHSDMRANRDKGESDFRNSERKKRIRDFKQRWNKDSNAAKGTIMRSDRPDSTDRGEREHDGRHKDKSKRDRLKSHFMEKLKQDNPERYEKIKARMDQFRKLDGETRELAKAYKGADEAKKAKIKALLLGILSQTFDMRQEERRLKMKMVEQRLDALKKEIEMRQTHKSEVIQRYFEELTGDKKHLEW